jgi:cell wall-associated NlpC family hydrolase
MNEPASGLPAAGNATTRRPQAGFSCLLPLLLLVSPLAMADNAGASIGPAPVSDPVPMADRSMLFGADLDQLIASQPTAARPEPTPKMSDRVQALLRRATALLGTPYRWGGESENGFDCSGLVGYVFKTALGIDLPRVSREMARSGEKVERDALSAGDLVFFSRRGRRVDHVGIYMGNGKFVHAPRTGKDVMVSRLDNGYWARKFMQARRVADI